MRRHALALSGFIFMAFLPPLTFADYNDSLERIKQSCDNRYPQAQRTARLKCKYDALKNAEGIPHFYLEMAAYAVMQSVKVDRGEISEEESEYLFQAKLRELTERLEQSARAQADQQQQQECVRMKKSGIECTGMYSSRTCVPVSTDQDRRDYQRVPSHLRCKTFWGDDVEDHPMYEHPR